MAQEETTAVADGDPSADCSHGKVVRLQPRSDALGWLFPTDDELGFPIRTAAVADDEANWGRFRDRFALDSDSGTDSNAHSIAGDIVDSEAGDTDDPAVAALRRLEKSAPKNPIQGQPQRGLSSKRNNEPEVGNFGL